MIFSLGEHFTFCPRPGHCVDGLDQLWFSASSLECVARRPLFTSDEERQQILATGLPSVLNPSDHIPIGASFSWKGAVAMETKDEPEKVEGGQAITVAAVVAALPDLSQLASDRQGVGIDASASAGAGVDTGMGILLDLRSFIQRFFPCK